MKLLGIGQIGGNIGQAQKYREYRALWAIGRPETKILIRKKDFPFPRLELTLAIHWTGIWKRGEGLLIYLISSEVYLPMLGKHTPVQS